MVSHWYHSYIENTYHRSGAQQASMWGLCGSLLVAKACHEHAEAALGCGPKPLNSKRTTSTGVVDVLNDWNVHTTQAHRSCSCRELHLPAAGCPAS